MTWIGIDFDFSLTTGLGKMDVNKPRYGISPSGMRNAHASRYLMYPRCESRGQGKELGCRLFFNVLLNHMLMSFTYKNSEQMFTHGGIPNCPDNNNRLAGVTRNFEFPTRDSKPRLERIVSTDRRFDNSATAASSALIWRFELIILVSMSSHGTK